jgi:hypothetical protein
LRLVPFEPQLLSKEPQPLLLIAPAVAAQDHLQALLTLCCSKQRLEGPAQFIQVPEADPSLILQIIASLVIAVVGREVGAVLERRIADQDPIQLFTEFGDLESKPKPAKCYFFSLNFQNKNNEIKLTYYIGRLYDAGYYKQIFYWEPVLRIHEILVRIWMRIRIR